MVVSLIVVLAPPAHAEGSWTSYFSAVFPGIKTRTTEDKNIDAHSTYTKYRLCKFDRGVQAVERINMQLNRERSLLPDENMGSVNYACAGSTWLQYNYGRLPAGKYHSRLNSVNGETRHEYLPPLNIGTSSSHGVAFNY